jgi:hypothetical protein
VGNSGSNTARAVRIVVALVAVACFVIGGALTAAYLAVVHIVTTTAIDYAKALGLTLVPAEVRFGPTFIQLLDCKFVALEVPGVSGSVRRIDVDLSGLHPSRMLLTDVAINAKGDPFELRDSAWRYWERVRPKSPSQAESALPKVEWQHLAVNVVTDNAFLPTVSLTELTIATNVGPTHDETTIRTATTHAGAFDLGALELAIRDQDGTFELGWGPTLLESRWRVAYGEVKNADQVRLSFQPLPVKELFERLGAPSIPPALSATKLSGHVEALRDRTNGKTTGAITLNLTGFVPPYPPELKGYHFADTTTLRAKFEVDPLFLAVELRGIELQTGDLSLTGHGRIDRELFSARLRAELATTLDCVTLARGYASEEIGGELGQWGAKNAPKAIRGAVSVKVQVDADSSRLDAAKVKKRIGIGCGLRPMSIEDLLNLGLPPIPDPKTVERLVKQIPPETVISHLPTLPNLLPSLDEMLDVSSHGNKPKPAAVTTPKKTAGSTKVPK